MTETAIIVPQYYLPMLLTFLHLISVSEQPQAPVQFFLSDNCASGCCASCFWQRSQNFFAKTEISGVCLFLNKTGWPTNFHNRILVAQDRKYRIYIADTFDNGLKK